MTIARTLHLWLSWLLLVALVVQFFLAGAGAFGATSWDPHSALGFYLVPASLLLLLLALVGRVVVRWSLALFLLIVLQLVLGAAGSDREPWLGPLHAVNALAVIGVAHVIAIRARRSAYAPADAPEPAP